MDHRRHRRRVDRRERDRRGVCAAEAGEEEQPVEGPLSGRTYVITGTLERFSREQATAAIEALGAKVGNSVSSKTTGLFVGEEPGASKLTKAQKAGVPILGEADLVQLLEAR